jgi:hypothetical protein
MFLKEIRRINRELLIETMSPMFGEESGKLLVSRLTDDEVSNTIAALTDVISTLAVDRFNDDEMEVFLTATTQPYENTVFGDMVTGYVKSLFDEEEK